jgi:hypothetical protein
MTQGFFAGEQEIYYTQIGNIKVKWGGMMRRSEPRGRYASPGADILPRRTVGSLRARASEFWGPT